MSMDLVTPSNHLIFCCPLFLLPSIIHSTRVFSNESTVHIRWPKYWSFTFNINPSNQYSGLIPFRMDWFDLLAVQGTLKSLLQHHNSKPSILWRSAFFMVQLSHPYMTTGKTIALTRWTFVGKVMSLLFNNLSRLGITFLPRRKPLLISWLQSPSAVILEPKKRKSVTVPIAGYTNGIVSLKFEVLPLEGSREAQTECPACKTLKSSKPSLWALTHLSPLRGPSVTHNPGWEEIEKQLSDKSEHR